MNYIEELEFKLEKILGFRNMQEKLENVLLKMLSVVTYLFMGFLSFAARLATS